MNSKYQPSLKYYLTETVVVTILVCATFLINLRMIRDGLNGNNDLIWHATWLQHFFKQLSEGILSPRWLAGTNYGYGSPTFVMNPPLVYYYGSFLKFFGLNTENAIICLFSLALFFSGFNFYIYANNNWESIPSLIGGLIYMTSPYLAFQMYWVSSITTFFAISLFPLIWYLTDKFLANPFKAKWTIALSISWTALALTHVPSTMLGFTVWIVCMLFSLKNNSGKVTLGAVISSFIGLGIASFFYIPAVLEKSLLNLEAVRSLGGGFKEMMLGSQSQSLIPLSFNYLPPHIFVHQLTVIAILSVITLIFFLLTKKNIRDNINWLLFCLVLAFFMTSLSWPIWYLFPSLQIVQAPWRLLHIFSFICAVFLTVVVNKVYIIRARFIFKVIVSITIIGILTANFNFGYKLSRRFPTIHNPGRANIEHLSYFKTILNDPYTDKLIDIETVRPLLANGQPSPKPKKGEEPVSIIDGKAQVNIKSWESYKRIFDVTAEEKSTIRVRTYYYLAWHLYVDGNSQEIQHLDDGTMGVNVNPGNHIIELYYQSTPAFKLGILLSILSLIMMILFSFFSAKILKQKRSIYS